MRIRFSLFASICCLQFAIVAPVAAQESERLSLGDRSIPAVQSTTERNTVALEEVKKEANSDNSLIQPAFQFFPDFSEVIPSQAKEVKLPSLSLRPLSSLLRVQPMKQVGDVVKNDNVSLIEPVAPPTLGPPQLPNITKLLPATFHQANDDSTVVIAQDVAAKIEDKPIAGTDKNSEMLSVEEIVGPLKSQEKIFGNLKIDPVALPTAAVDPNDMRLEILPDGTKAAWQGDIYSWSAPAFYHNPLYFEQVNLERYGQGPYRCLQPAVSGAMFFATIPILPYRIGVQHWDERVYTLGHYRPGNLNPYQIHYSPFSWRGVLYQGAATSGLVFALP